MRVVTVGAAQAAKHKTDRSMAEEVATIARRELDRHGLTDWRFEFDRANVRFGACFYQAKKITLSVGLTEANWKNNRAEVIDTIRHEVAHALAGYEAGHGPKWRRACITTGATPTACYSPSKVLPSTRKRSR